MNSYMIQDSKGDIHFINADYSDFNERWVSFYGRLRNGKPGCLARFCDSMSFIEIPNQKPDTSISLEQRVHKLQTDRNELRAEVLGLKAEIEDLRTDLYLNTKDRL